MGIVISEEEYQRLVDRDTYADALDFAGVDNWSGYDEAMKSYEGWKNENRIGT